MRVLRSTGDASLVTVARGSTVADLKAAIATALADAPAERQRLIFGGKPLEDGPWRRAAWQTVRRSTSRCGPSLVPRNRIRTHT